VPVSPYFDDYDNNLEQQLLDDLVVESVQLRGMNVYYVPKVIGTVDKVFHEDPTARYETAYKIEMYLKSVDGFEGQSDLLTKFGLSLTQQVRWSVARTTFNNIVGLDRPREGDIVYFPRTKRVFVIKFVDKFETFLQLGDYYTYELTTELFEYSGEKFSTGIEDLDRISNFNLSSNAYDLSDENGNVLTDENGNTLTTENYSLDNVDTGADNDWIQKATDSIVDWSKTDPFSEFGKV